MYVNSISLDLLQEFISAFGTISGFFFGFATVTIFCMYGIYKVFGLISTITK